MRARRNGADGEDFGLGLGQSLARGPLEGLHDGEESLHPLPSRSILQAAAAALQERLAVVGKLDGGQPWNARNADADATPAQQAEQRLREAVVEAAGQGVALPYAGQEGDQRGEAAVDEGC